VIAAHPARAVTLHMRTAGSAALRTWPMAAQRGYRYAASLPAGTLPAGVTEYFFSVETEGGTVRCPAEADRFLTTQVVTPNQPLPLFDGAQDIPQLVYTRIGDNVRHGVFKSMPATDADPAALRLLLPLSYDRTLDDYTASLAVKDRIFDRSGRLAAAKALRVKARGASAGQGVFLTLVEADGTSWSTRLSLPSAWQEVVVPLAGLRIARGVKLPLGYPERWNYWVAPAKGRGGSTDRPNLAAVEHLQISLRPESGGPKPKEAGADAWVDLASVALVFE
jgi:hypothetical protein